MRRGAAANRRKAVKQRNRMAQHDEELETEKLQQREEEHQEHVETPAQRMAHASETPTTPPGEHPRGGFQIINPIEITELDAALEPYRDYTDLSTEEINNPDYGIAGEEREPGEEADEKKNQLQPQQSTSRHGPKSRLEDPKSEEEADLESATKAETTEMDSGGSSPEDGGSGGDGETPVAPPSSPMDGGGMAASQGAAQGLAQLNKANQATSAAASQQPKLESAEGESDATVEQQKQAKKERRRVAKITSRFQNHHAKQADELNRLAQNLPNDFQNAAKSAQKQVNQATKNQTSALTKHYDGLRKQANKKANNVEKAIIQQRTKAIVGLSTVLSEAYVRLAVAFADVQASIGSKTASQNSRVEAIYQEYYSRFQQVGIDVGNSAVAKAEVKAKGWEGQKDPSHPDNTWYNGPMHDKRLDAKAEAARSVGQGFQEAYVQQGQDQANASMAGMERDLKAVNDQGTQISTLAQEFYDGILANLQQYQADAEADAMAKAQKMLDELENQLTAYLALLDTEEAARKNQVEAYANRQNAAIQKAADDAAGSLTEGTGRALEDYNQDLAGIVTAIDDLEGHPDPDELKELLAEATTEMDGAYSEVLNKINDARSQGLQAITQGGEATITRIDKLGESALLQSEATQNTFLERLEFLKDKSQEAFNTLSQTHTDAVYASLTSAEEQFADMKSRGFQAFQKMEEQLTSAFATSESNFRDGLERHLDSELMPKVNAEATKAADKVQPRWKGFLKIIAVIAVVVVITVVAGPAAIGVVGALAAKALGAGALATAIGTVVGGAITGAIAGAAGAIVGNLIDGKDDVFEGVGKSMITGAIGGAFGGLGGLLIKSGMSVGLKLTIDVGMDTIGAVLGDLAVGNPITLGSIAAGALVALGFSGLANAKSIRERLKPKTVLVDAAGNPMGRTARTAAKKTNLVDADSNPLAGGGNRKADSDSPGLLDADGNPLAGGTSRKADSDSPGLLDASGNPLSGKTPKKEVDLLGADGQPMKSGRKESDPVDLLDADGNPIKKKHDDSWSLVDENGKTIRKSMNAKITDDLGRLKNQFDDLPQDVKTKAFDVFDQIKALPERIEELKDKLKGLSATDLKQAKDKVTAQVKAVAFEIIDAAETLLIEAKRIGNMDLKRVAKEAQEKAQEMWKEAKEAIQENTAWNQARKGGVDAYDPTNIRESITEAAHKQVGDAPVSSSLSKFTTKVNPVSKAALKKEAKGQLKGLSQEYAKKVEEKEGEKNAKKRAAIRSEAQSTMPGLEHPGGQLQPIALSMDDNAPIRPSPTSTPDAMDTDSPTTSEPVVTTDSISTTKDSAAESASPSAEHEEPRRTSESNPHVEARKLLVQRGMVDEETASNLSEADLHKRLVAEFKRTDADADIAAAEKLPLNELLEVLTKPDEEVTKALEVFKRRGWSVEGSSVVDCKAVLVRELPLAKCDVPVRKLIRMSLTELLAEEQKLKSDAAEKRVLEDIAAGRGFDLGAMMSAGLIGTVSEAKDDDEADKEEDEDASQDSEQNPSPSKKKKASKEAEDAELIFAAHFVMISNEWKTKAEAILIQDVEKLETLFVEELSACDTGMTDKELQDLDLEELLDLEEKLENIRAATEKAKVLAQEQGWPTTGTDSKSMRQLFVTKLPKVGSQKDERVLFRMSIMQLVQELEIILRQPKDVANPKEFDSQSFFVAEQEEADVASIEDLPKGEAEFIARMILVQRDPTIDQAKAQTLKDDALRKALATALIQHSASQQEPANLEKMPLKQLLEEDEKAAKTESSLNKIQLVLEARGWAQTGRDDLFELKSDFVSGLIQSGCQIERRKLLRMTLDQLLQTENKLSALPMVPGLPPHMSGIGVMVEEEAAEGPTEPLSMVEAEFLARQTLVLNGWKTQEEVDKLPDPKAVHQAFIEGLVHQYKMDEKILQSLQLTTLVEKEEEAQQQQKDLVEAIPRASKRNWDIGDGSYTEVKMAFIDGLPTIGLDPTVTQSDLLKMSLPILVWEEKRLANAISTLEARPEPPQARPKPKASSGQAPKDGSLPRVDMAPSEFVSDDELLHARIVLKQQGLDAAAADGLQTRTQLLEAFIPIVFNLYGMSEAATTPEGEAQRKTERKKLEASDIPSLIKKVEGAHLQGVMRTEAFHLCQELGWECPNPDFDTLRGALILGIQEIDVGYEPGQLLKKDMAELMDVTQEVRTILADARWLCNEVGWPIRGDTVESVRSSLTTGILVTDPELSTASIEGCDLKEVVEIAARYTKQAESMALHRVQNQGTEQSYSEQFKDAEQTDLKKVAQKEQEEEKRKAEAKKKKGKKNQKKEKKAVDEDTLFEARIILISEKELKRQDAKQLSQRPLSEQTTTLADHFRKHLERKGSTKSEMEISEMDLHELLSEYDDLIEASELIPKALQVAERNHWSRPHRDDVKYLQELFVAELPELGSQKSESKLEKMTLKELMEEEETVQTREGMRSARQRMQSGQGGVDARLMLQMGVFDGTEVMNEIPAQNESSSPVVNGAQHALTSAPVAARSGDHLGSGAPIIDFHPDRDALKSRT